MFKKILLVIVVMIALTGCYKKSKNKVIKAKYNIVTSNYVSYDLCVLLLATIGILV